MGTIKIFNVNDIIKKTNIKTFIETGTLHGEAVEFANRFPFEEIHSIEIIEDLANKAKNKFKNNPKIKIHQGHSAEVLNQILPAIKTDILFWLDAHFPGVDSRHKSINEDMDTSIRIPLEKELNAILQRVDSFKDIIIIDDLWVYEDCPCESGKFNDHMKRMNWNITREEVCKGGIGFVKELFENTHSLNKDYRHQGYIILQPKKGLDGI